MEFLNISIDLKNQNEIHLPLNQTPRQIVIEPSKSIAKYLFPDQIQKSKITLLCYKIHLIQENKDAFVYLFKNINPSSIWYEKKIREGDRLIILNDQDLTWISSESISSIMNKNSNRFTCQVIWHPELYIRFKINDVKSRNRIQNESIEARKFIDDTMYEYLRKMLHHLLDYRPKETLQLVENFSKTMEPSIEDQSDSNKFIQKQLNLLSNRWIIDGNAEEIMKNMLELNQLFEHINVGLNKEEVYWIWLLMKSLLKEKPNIKKLDFWGKIFGIKNDYYIFEVDFETFDDIDLNDSEVLKYQESLTIDEENETDEQINIDKKKLPFDSIGNGVNQKIFFVATGSEYLTDKPLAQLPLLTPEQIENSRRIQQFFTGDLEAKVKFDENFPGVEKHLLRAQIQRITAGTHIGPRNYLKNTINEEEQTGEETIDARQTKLHMNSEFIGNTLEDLALQNGQYWNHYAPYLIHSQKDASPEEYSSIDKDSTLDPLHSAWSINIASTLVPEQTLISVRSNRWPGAFTIGDRFRFENVYIGWGIKNFLETHQANMIDIFPENEYLSELIEIDDPTIEEESGLFKSSILLSPDEDEEFENE